MIFRANAIEITLFTHSLTIKKTAPIARGIGSIIKLNATAPDITKKNKGIDKRGVFTRRK